jgi:succinyl-CoA synthetase beta subunit
LDLYEHQGKELLRKFGIETLEGVVAGSPEEARAAAEQLGEGPIAVKAQVLTGGRGKAGGIKVVKEPEDVERYDASSSRPGSR